MLYVSYFFEIINVYFCMALKLFKCVEQRFPNLVLRIKAHLWDIGNDPQRFSESLREVIRGLKNFHTFIQMALICVLDTYVLSMESKFKNSSITNFILYL